MQDQVISSDQRRVITTKSLLTSSYQKTSSIYKPQLSLLTFIIDLPPSNEYLKALIIGTEIAYINLTVWAAASEELQFLLPVLLTLTLISRGQETHKFEQSYPTNLSAFGVVVEYIHFQKVMWGWLKGKSTMNVSAYII